MGIDVDHLQRVVKLNTKSKESSCLVNGGVYILDPNFIKSLTKQEINSQSWENETLPTLLNKHIPIFAQKYSADFIDIGIPADYIKAQEFLFSQG
jgi:NDP-sugar pyrophosphorylase family protein